MFGTSHATSDLRKQVAEAVASELKKEQEDTPLAGTDLERLTRELTADILGYGPIEPHLADDDVTEIMVNGYNRIYVERFGVIEPSTASFVDDDHLLRIIDKIVSQVGRRVDESSPMVDARLPDGSRVNAIIPPLSLRGPTSDDPQVLARSVHDQRPDRLRLADRRRAASSSRACVQGELNILISGGTGTGKTTMLNGLSDFIPETERIVTIEDAAELQLQQDHVVRLESRPSNVEGERRVQIRELVRNALRMRPDRIVVGECRGAGDARHAPGDEHRPRRVVDDDPRELGARRLEPSRDDGAHVGHPVPAQGDSRAGRERT